MLRTITFLLGMCIIIPAVAVAQSWQAHSGDTQLAVLELFSAEGCGLCPAAYRWVEQLPDKNIGDDKVIVLSFHVDYLNDKKGWIDKFAKPQFSERQRQLARLNLYHTIFTPEFFISGEVVHSWREYGIEAIEFVNSFRPQASVRLQVNKQAQVLDISADVSVSGAENREHAKLYLALTEDDVSSHVQGGDNAGATFNHQDLVRAWLGPFTLEKDGDSTVNTRLDVQQHWDLNKMSLVAVVHNLSDGYVLQGLSLPLHEKK